MLFTSLLTNLYLYMWQDFFFSDWGQPISNYGQNIGFDESHDQISLDQEENLDFSIFQESLAILN